MKETVITTTEMHFDWKDRFKILCGHVVNLQTKTEIEVVDDKVRPMRIISRAVGDNLWLWHPWKKRRAMTLSSRGASNDADGKQPQAQNSQRGKT